MVIVKTRLRKLIGKRCDTVYLHADEDVLRAYKLKMPIKDYALKFYNAKISKVMMSNSKSFKELFKDESETFVFNRLGIDYMFFYSASLREALKLAVDIAVNRLIKARGEIERVADILSSFNVKSRSEAEKKLFYLLFNYSKMRIAVSELALKLIEEGVKELKRKFEIKERMGYSFKIVPVVQWYFGHERVFLEESIYLLSSYGEEELIAIEDGLKVSPPQGVRLFIIRKNEIIDAPAAVLKA